MALGVLIIQKRMNLSDRELVKSIEENPYYQYFVGLRKFTAKCPFTAPVLVFFRKRFTAKMLMKVNEILLQAMKSTPEHEKDKVEKAEDGQNTGTMILDATASPSNIRYPQDFSLLNEAREKTDAMIDCLHKQFVEKRHPRTYREKLHTAYLSVAKSKKRTLKAIRVLIYRLLCTLERNLNFVDFYLARGGEPHQKSLETLETIRILYKRQREMFNQRKHSVERRIVRVSQPYIRPIVRGKVKTPVAFGAKYDVNIDEKDHSRLKRLGFEAFNECDTLEAIAERYRERTGHCPKHILVDKIYNAKGNRVFCKGHGIRISGRGPGTRQKRRTRSARLSAKTTSTGMRWSASSVGRSTPAVPP